MRWFRFGRRKNDGVATATRQTTADAMDDRRRLRDAPYVLPSDDKEINRLDFQHYMLRYALRGNFAADAARASPNTSIWAASAGCVATRRS